MNNKRIILILLILVLVLTSLGFGYHTYSKIRSDDNNLKSTQIIKAQSKRFTYRGWHSNSFPKLLYLLQSFTRTNQPLLS